MTRSLSNYVSTEAGLDHSDSCECHNIYIF